MRQIPIFIGMLLALCVFIIPVHAAGNLSVTATNLAPQNINTNTSTAMLNLSLNSTVGTVAISSINVTIIGINMTNVTSIEVRDDSYNVVGTNSSLNSSNLTNIILTGVSVTTAANKSLVIALNLSTNAIGSLSVNITDASDFGLDAMSNASIAAVSLQSGSSSIVDLHIAAKIIPLLIDTGIINQTLQINLTTVGRNYTNFTVLTIPTEYKIVNVTRVLIGTTEITPNVTVVFNRTTGVVNLSCNLTNGFNNLTGSLLINLTVNVTSSAAGPLVINSTISGSDLSAVVPYVYGTNTSVRAQQLINITSMTVIKGSAVTNGTDYWEFNLSANFSANVSGLVQFKQSNWINSAGQSIALIDGATFYSTLRDSSDSSRVINAVNEYNYSTGMTPANCCTAGNIYNFILKMIVPSGTPSSISWFSSYGIVFRSS
jgi:hypothetical protein